jgi:division protein CdvB (Snf7/Vps24/ESCRT-III family)
MGTTLSNFRSQMFRLMTKVRAGVPLTITYKNENYVLTKAKTRKEKIIKQLQSLPKLIVNEREMKEMINWGRE